ncbi:MAG TPA: TIGR03790 family protein [Gammaproteobacteria bacterium]
MQIKHALKIYLLLILVLLNRPLLAEVNNNNIALLVNGNDPESIEIAEYYQQRRHIPDQHVIYLDFVPGKDHLSETEFADISRQLAVKVNDNIQAYALAWRKPWRVGCMSITSAFAFGFDKSHCASGCKAIQASDYYDSDSRAPYADYGLRPSMLLSAKSVKAVKELIDRGVAADYSRGRVSQVSGSQITGAAYLLSTSDKLRNVRAGFYPRIEQMLGSVLVINRIQANKLQDRNNILFYFTGLKRVWGITDNYYLPGAMADHLTSAGGQLFSDGQMSILEWIDAGVTASYGTVVEPCNFTDKFPQPGVAIEHYLAGNMLLEAYWKSVRMPGQGVFVGEPLAAPFKGCDIENTAGQLHITNNTSKELFRLEAKSCLKLF